MQRMSLMLFQPPVGVEIVILFAPQHACEALTHDASRSVSALTEAGVTAS